MFKPGDKCRYTANYARDGGWSNAHNFDFIEVTEFNWNLRRMPGFPQDSCTISGIIHYKDGHSSLSPSNFDPRFLQLIDGPPSEIDVMGLLNTLPKGEL